METASNDAAVAVGIFVFWISLTLVMSTVWGFVAAAIANSKGHSKYLWFALGFFLGLIGVLIIGLMGDVRKPETVVAYMKQCKFCKEPVQMNAVICKHCGGALD